ncbi:MAG: DUF3109 family protein [Candidatus Aenigmarchaeota archaeon]|nr:DUF3109 family protein [Candidatus Aenigmarchaeota archaeon]
MNKNTKTSAGLTAFAEAEQEMRKRFSHVPIDTKSFLRPLKRCSLKDCKGICCYDGVYLEKGGDRVIEKIVARERDFFKDLGLNLPDKVITEDLWLDGSVEKKTSVRPRAFSKNVVVYPAHFNDTACVFLKEDGQCGLQMLAETRGQHSWYYKPLGCWLHPIHLESEGKDLIILEDEKTDSCRSDGYVGYVTCTPCGSTYTGGALAYEVLREELKFLGKILNRNLVKEIKEGTGR